MINVKQFFHFITVDPVNLSIKGRLLSVVSFFIAILVVAWITRKFSASASYPIIVASMGPSAVMLFIIPHSPLAQPWSVGNWYQLWSGYGVLRQLPIRL